MPALAIIVLSASEFASSQFLRKYVISLMKLLNRVGPRNKPCECIVVVDSEKTFVQRLSTKHSGTRLRQVGHGAVTQACVCAAAHDEHNTIAQVNRAVFRKYGVQNNSIYGERSNRVYRQVTGIGVKS